MVGGKTRRSSWKMTESAHFSTYRVVSWSSYTRFPLLSGRFLLDPDKALGPGQSCRRLLSFLAGNRLSTLALHQVQGSPAGTGEEEGTASKV